METETGGYVRIHIQCELGRASVQLFVRACVRRSSIVQCPSPSPGAVEAGKGDRGGCRAGGEGEGAQRLRGFTPGVGGGVRREAGIAWASVGNGSAGFRGVMRYGWRLAGNSLRTCS